MFKSPRPSVTLSEIQRREVKKGLSQCGDAYEDEALWLEDNTEVTPGDISNGCGDQDNVVVRGGHGNNPWDELWMAQGLDIGADPSVFEHGSAEAQKAWEETALIKHDDEEWNDLSYNDVEMPDTKTMKKFEEVEEWEDEEALMCSESEGWSEKSIDEDE